MDRIFRHSTALLRYRIADGISVDLDHRGRYRAGGLEIEVVDPTDAYAALMQKLFDFDRMKAWLADHRIVFDAMHAITGPYARRLLVEVLGAPPESVLNAEPKEDFGGGKPDPNMATAPHLVKLARSAGAPDLVAASDGDGDRNFIMGRGMFVTPGDSLAVLAAHLRELPGYRDGIKGVARSMPTSRALDKVAHESHFDCYETPSGWKFFTNLLDAGKVTLCGEEAFGTSSSHIREKDGLWAVLAWINLLAATRLSASEVVEQHWRRYGRHYFLRHDYEGLPAPDAMNVMQELGGEIEGLAGQVFGEWKVTRADEFEYHDPVDGTLALSQGLRVVFGDLARIVVRVSGTGTQDTTLRLYLERYEHSSGTLNWDPAEALAPLINVAEKIVKIGALTGRNGPTLVT
jgi:phosphoglucomutase